MTVREESVERKGDISGEIEEEDIYGKYMGLRIYNMYSKKIEQ